MKGSSGAPPTDAMSATRIGVGRQPVSTLAVRALLMAFDFSPQRTAYQQRRCQQLQRLGRLIEQELPALAKPPHHVKWGEVNPKRTVSGWRLDACSRVGA